MKVCKAAVANVMTSSACAPSSASTEHMLQWNGQAVSSVITAVKDPSCLPLWGASSESEVSESAHASFMKILWGSLVATHAVKTAF